MRDLERLGADVLAGMLPRIYPQMLAVAHEHQDAGRRVYIVTAASQELARCWPTCWCSTARSGQSSPRSRTACTPGGRPACSSIAATRRGRSGSWPRARASTSRPPTPTRTRSPTCRCSRRSATRVAVNPDPELARVAREQGWDVLRFDRLGRRLKAAIALAGAAVAGGVGSAALASRSRRRKLPISR